MLELKKKDCKINKTGIRVFMYLLAIQDQPTIKSIIPTFLNLTLIPTLRTQSHPSFKFTWNSSPCFSLQYSLIFGYTYSINVFRSINMSVKVELVKIRTILELTGGKFVKQPAKMASIVFSSIVAKLVIRFHQRHPDGLIISSTTPRVLILKFNNPCN